MLSGNPEYKNVFTENMELANKQGAHLHELTKSEAFDKYQKMAQEWDEYIQSSVFAVYDLKR